MLLLWVNWSTHAAQSRHVLLRAVDMQQASGLAIPCFSADVSEQAGELWDTLHAWLRDEPATSGELLWAGSGPTLWLRDGKVVHQLIDTMNHTPAEIAALQSLVV